MLAIVAQLVFDADAGQFDLPPFKRSVICRLPRRITLELLDLGLNIAGRSDGVEDALVAGVDAACARQDANQQEQAKGEQGRWRLERPGQGHADQDGDDDSGFITRARGRIRVTETDSVRRGGTRIFLKTIRQAA